MPEWHGGGGVGNANTPPGAGSGLVVTDGTHSFSNISTIVVTGSAITSGSPGSVTISTSGSISVPAAGIVASNGTVLTHATIAAGLSLSADGQTLSNSGILNVTEGSGILVSVTAGTANVSNQGVIGIVASGNTITGDVDFLGGGATTLSVIGGNTLEFSSSAGLTVPPAGLVASNGTVLTNPTLSNGVSVSVDGQTLYNTGVLAITEGASTLEGTITLAGTAGTTLSVSGQTIDFSSTAISVPPAGLVYSNGTVLSDATIGTGLALSGATLSNAGIVSLTAAGTTDTGAVTLAAAGILTLAVSGQTATYTASAPSAGIVVSNGTSLSAGTLVGVSYNSGTITVDPPQANFNFAGTGAAWPAEITVPVTETYVLGANFANSQLYAGTAPTGTVDAAVAYVHSGTSTSIGNLIYTSTGNTLGTSSAVTLVPGNVLIITPSTTADATAANLSGALSLARVGP